MTRPEAIARFKDMIEVRALTDDDDVSGRRAPGDGLGAAGFDTCMFM